MRSFSIILVGALLLVGASSNEVARAHCGNATRIHDFHIETKWTKKVYATSEKATVVVTVTMPAHEDPLELGIELEPPVSVPAEGVGVWTTLVTRTFPPPYGYGVTDADGQVKFKIRLGDVKPGRITATHYASRWTNRDACPDIEEWGYKLESPAITVAP